MFTTVPRAFRRLNLFLEKFFFHFFFFLSYKLQPRAINYVAVQLPKGKP